MRPLRLAPRVWLTPNSAERPRESAGDDVIVLAQRDSRAFGDGSHPTTRLCARGVDLVCRQHRPAAVLDVGTGTGVLARLARAHGAAFVVATDVEQHSLATTAMNARLDADRGGAFLIRDARDAAPDTWGPRFELVIANILAEVLVALAQPLAQALSPGGRLLLSGFTAPQAPPLRACFAAHGLAVEVQADHDGWCALQLVAPTSTPKPLPRRTTFPFPTTTFVAGQTPRPPADFAATVDDDARFDVGLDLFDHGYGFEAHELWEPLWHRAKAQGDDVDAAFLRACIKLAAAQVKQRQENLAGVRGHADDALALLVPVGAVRHRGVLVDDLRAVAALAAVRGVVPARVVP